MVEMDDWPIDPLSPAKALVLLVLTPVAIALAIPIFLVTFAVALAVGAAMTNVGVPDPFPGLVLLGFGFGGGLAILFLVLVRLYRRFEPRIRKLRTLTTPPGGRGSLRPPRDPSADPASLTDRVSALDAGLTSTDDRGDPYQ